MLPRIERNWSKTGAKDNNNEPSGKPQTFLIWSLCIKVWVFPEKATTGEIISKGAL
jgi:hypothetical protein